MYYEKAMKNNYHLERPNKNNAYDNQAYSQNIKLEPPRSFSQWKTNNSNNQQYRMTEQDRPKSITSHQSNGKPLKNSRLSDYIAQEAKNLIQQRQPYLYSKGSPYFLAKKHDRCRSLYDEYQYKTGTSQPQKQSFHYNENVNEKIRNNNFNEQMYAQNNEPILYEIPSFGLDIRSHHSHSQSKNTLSKVNSHSLFTTLQQRNSSISKYPQSHKLQPVYQKQNKIIQNSMKRSTFNNNRPSNKQINSKIYQQDIENQHPYLNSQQKLKRSRKSLPKQTLLTANLNISRRNSNQKERKYHLKELDNQRIQNMNQINTKIQNILFALEQQSSHQEEFNRRYSPQKSQIPSQSPIYSNYNSKYFQSSWQNPFCSKQKKQQNFNQLPPQRQTLSSLIPNLCETYIYDNSYQVNEINQTVNQFQLGSRYFKNDQNSLIDSRNRHEQQSYFNNERYTFGVESRYAQNKGSSHPHHQNLYGQNVYSDHIKQDNFPAKSKEIYPNSSDLGKSVQNIRKRRQYQKSQQKIIEQEFKQRKSVFEDIKKSYLYSKNCNSNSNQKQKQIQYVSPKKSNRNKRCQTQTQTQAQTYQYFDHKRYEQLAQKYAFNKKIQKSQDFIIQKKRNQLKNNIITNFRQNNYHDQVNEKARINNLVQEKNNLLKRQYSAKSLGHKTDSFSALRIRQNQKERFSQYQDKSSLIVKGKNVNDQIEKIQKKIESFEQMKKELNIQSKPVSDRSRSARSQKSRQCSPRLTNQIQKSSEAKFKQNNNILEVNKMCNSRLAQRVKTQSDIQLLKIRENYSRQKQQKISPILKNQPLKEFSSYFGADNQKILQKRNQNTYLQKYSDEQKKTMGNKQNISTQAQKQLEKAKYVEYQQVSTPRLLRNLKSRQQNKLKKQKKFKSQFMKDLNSFDRLTAEENQYKNSTERSNDVQTPKLSGNRQLLNSLLKKLQNQITLDQNFRNLKKWFNSLNYKQKWMKLSQQLSQKKIKLSQNQIQQIFFLTQQQNNPFFSTRGHESSYSNLIQSYVQCQNNWQQIKNSLSQEEIKQLEQAGFNQKSLDIDRKGYICIEDLTRFINLQMNQYYRNRDIILIWRRLNFETIKQKQKENAIQQKVFFEKMMKTLLKNPAKSKFSK